MKAPSPATSLARFGLISMLLSSGTDFLQAQPAAGYGLAPGAVEAPAYRPMVPVPPKPPGPPPQGYVGPQPRYTPPSYTPPGLSSSRKPTSSKTSSTTSKKTPATAAKTTVKKPSVTTIESKVARLESNDRRQDLRLSHLERDVGLLPDTIEGGGMADAIPTGKRYVMRPGDTLWSVASRHGVSINALRRANHLSEADVMGLGETLIIPDGSSSLEESAATQSVSRSHTVTSGETFTKIARDYGITVDELARANPTAYADRLLIGERLTIPGGHRGSRSVAAPRTVVTTTSKITHTVKKGEHLGSIAKKYGVSTASLAAANRLKNANIVVVGQRLTIPGGKTITRTVPANLAAEPDTIPLQDMRLSEPLPPVKPEPPAPSLPPITGPGASSTSLITSSPSPAPRGVVAYRMERGDSIETVANMFSTTPQNIRALNKLSADQDVKEGEEIIVPSIGAVSVN